MAGKKKQIETIKVGVRTFKTGDLPFSREQIDAMKKDIIDDENVQKWFKAVKSARTTYLKPFAMFCYVMGKNPSELKEIRYDDMDSKGRKDIVKEMINEFRIYLRLCPVCFDHNVDLDGLCPKCGHKKTFAPKTRSSMDGSVRGYWTNVIGRPAMIDIDNMVEGTSTIIQGYEPQLSDVANLLSHTNSVAEKLGIYLLFQTGLSKSDYQYLRYTQTVKNQLDAGEEVIVFDYIRVKHPELGKRKTAICYEAVDCLKDYLQTYKVQVGEPIMVGEGRRDANGLRKALKSDSLSEILHRVIKRSNIETGGGRLSTHSGRKFVTSAMTDANINEKFIKFVTGHAIPDVDRVYWFNNNQGIRENYTKIADRINPFKAEIKETLGLKETVARQSQDIADLKAMISQLSGQIAVGLANGKTDEAKTVSSPIHTDYKVTASALGDWTELDSPSRLL